MTYWVVFCLVMIAVGYYLGRDQRKADASAKLRDRVLFEDLDEDDHSWY